MVNAGVLLQGRLQVNSLNGESITLEAGDALIELVHTPHQGTSLGPEAAQIVVVCRGRVGTPITLPFEP